jgi:hypothetical protein
MFSRAVKSSPLDGYEYNGQLEWRAVHPCGGERVPKRSLAEYSLPVVDLCAVSGASQSSLCLCVLCRSANAARVEEGIQLLKMFATVGVQKSLLVRALSVRQYGSRRRGCTAIGNARLGRCSKHLRGGPAAVPSATNAPVPIVGAILSQVRWFHAH